MAWPVGKAKQKFSELLRRAHDEGPQVLTRHGREVAVLLSVEAYRELTGQRDFKAFLRSAPDMEGLDIVRAKDPLPSDRL